MIANNGPVQESIMRNLTAWEFRNLQLAGVRISIGQQVQKKHLIPNCCSERDPENQDRMCTNTTELFDEIRACAGHPLYEPDRRPALQRWIGNHKTKPCVQNKPWRVKERLPHVPGSAPEKEPNTEEHPVHTKVCRRCREFYAAKSLNKQLLTIAQCRWPLCKHHSLTLAMEYPLNACRCVAYINDRWRCRRCAADTLACLKKRASKARPSVVGAKFPLLRPWTLLRILLQVPWPLCPIQGCYEQASLHETTDCMKLCLGCNAIISI